jgi:hypothetical protein
VIYADSRHSVGNVPAANLGPFPPTLVADWLMARLNGKPLRSERWLVATRGRRLWRTGNCRRNIFGRILRSRESLCARRNRLRPNQPTQRSCLRN